MSKNKHFTLSDWLGTFEEKPNPAVAIRLRESAIGHWEDKIISDARLLEILKLIRDQLT